MGVRRWAAAVLVVVGVAFAGQARAGSEMHQTFKAAKQNGENLVEVIRLALQSGAELSAVAAAADEAGISPDIVTAAALAAGGEAPAVARAVERGSDKDLGYVEPAVSGFSAGNAVAPGGSPDALPGSAQVAAMDKDGNCPDDMRCMISSEESCCMKLSSDLEKCKGYEKCK